MRYFIIVNPHSGRGLGEKSVPAIESFLRERKMEYSLVRTERMWHAAELAERAARDGYDVIVCASGDGTFNEVLNGLMKTPQEKRPALAVLGSAALLGHITIVLGRATRRALAVVGGLLLLSVGLSALETWQNHRQWWPTGFLTAVRPPGWQLLGAGNLDRLYERSRAHQAELDALRSYDPDTGEADGE